MPARVLTVCTGNVCRSPVMASLLAARLGPHVQVVSRGTRAPAGAPMCEHSATWAMTHGTGAAKHAAQQLELADVRASTVILTAARTHRRAVVELRPSAQVRTFTLTQAARIASWLTRQDTHPPQAGLPERLLWLLEELDTHRGLAPLPDDDGDDDLPDPHRGADHAAVFERIVAAVDTLCAPILDTPTAGRR